MSTNVIYYNNDKSLVQSMRKRKIHIWKTLGSRAPQGRRLGDERLEVLVLLVAPGELPRVGRNWAAVEYPQEEKSRVGKSEYTTCTQQV